MSDTTPLTEDERAAIGIEPLIAKKAGRALSPVDSAMAVGIELGASLCRDFYSERQRALIKLAEFAQHDSWRCGEPKRFPWEPDCYCGLTAIQRAAGVPVDEPPIDRRDDDEGGER